MPGETWMEKMLKVMCAEAPQTEVNMVLHNKIAMAAGRRCSGMDHRKIGMFAADVMRIVQKKTDAQAPVDAR